MDIPTGFDVLSLNLQVLAWKAEKNASRAMRAVGTENEKKESERLLRSTDAWADALVSLLAAPNPPSA